MAEQLKHYYNAQVVESIADDLKRASSEFNAKAFVRDCLDGLDDLALIARGAHIATNMRKHLPQDYEAAAKILIASLRPRVSGGVSPMEPFCYLPHTIFISRHGLDHFELSMQALYELTQLFTAEFSIRAFIEKHPEATYARLVEWTKDPSMHVRRLVSEGTRPRLPWASRLREYQKDPAPVLQLLELLKDDPERYVQRSVANNLNDIGKDHPALVVDVCRRWSAGATGGREWIVKHALRSLVKKGDRGALGILGVDAAPKVDIRAIQFEPKRVQLGGKLAMSFELASTATEEQELLVDFAVHFVKANGERKPKVFKLSKVVLEKDARVQLNARVSFAEMTTRKHYPGKHAIEILVNGVAFSAGEFDVRA